MIIIRAFRAPESPQTCEKFIEGHRRLLELHYGIIKVTSAQNEWVHHKNTIVIVAENEDGSKVYGGARIQIADGEVPLPIETAIGKFDPKIHDMIIPYKTSELCGLWNSMEVAGLGIGSVFMVRSGVAVSLLNQVDTVFMLCAPVTVKMGKRVGGDLETSLGDKGYFIYPKEDLIATVLTIKDTKTLSTALETEREKIFTLAKNPNMQITEQGPRASIEIDYQLSI